MTEEELKDRFKAFSIRIINMVDNMPNTISGRAVGMLPAHRLKDLYQESQELLKITTSSILTAKRRLGGDNKE